MMPFGCVDFDFYYNVFLGSAISSADFPRLAARAAEFVDGMCRGVCRSVPEQDWPQLMFAVCAVADILQAEELMTRRAFSAGRDVASETVGDYSVSYANSALSREETGFLEKKKRETVKLYLSAVPALQSLFSVRSFLCTHHIR